MVMRDLAQSGMTMHISANTQHPKTQALFAAEVRH